MTIHKILSNLKDSMIQKSEWASINGMVPEIEIDEAIIEAEEEIFDLVDSIKE